MEGALEGVPTEWVAHYFDEDKREGALASVRTTTVQGFVRELEAKGLSAGSVRNIYDVTAQVFASAVDDRVIASTPCRKVSAA